jgi:hypothetical protein
MFAAMPFDSMLVSLAYDQKIIGECTVDIRTHLGVEDRGDRQRETVQPTEGQWNDVLRRTLYYGNISVSVWTVDHPNRC